MKKDKAVISDSQLVDTIIDRRRRTKVAKAYFKAATVTERLRLLELAQVAYYQRLERREMSGGPRIPYKWRRWKQAQDEYTK
jgi:hypothetical protein